MSPRALETIAHTEKSSLFFLGLWPCGLPWFLLTCSVVCGVWREKKESDVHLGVRVEQVSLFEHSSEVSDCEAATSIGVRVLRS